MIEEANIYRGPLRILPYMTNHSYLKLLQACVVTKNHFQGRFVQPQEVILKIKKENLVRKFDDVIKFFMRKIYTFCKKVEKNV